MGTCSSTFFSGLDGCLLGVSGTWYKDREFLDTQSDPTIYQVSSSGELRILSLGESTVGDYVCVTTLPMSLGNYITTAVGIALLPSKLPEYFFVLNLYTQRISELYIII